MKKLIATALTLTALTSHAMNANDKARVLEKLNSARSEMQSLRSLIPKVYRPIIDNNLKNTDQKIVEVSAIVTSSNANEDYNHQSPKYPNLPYGGCSEIMVVVKTKCNFYYHQSKSTSIYDLKNFEILAQGQNIVDAQNNLWKIVDSKKNSASSSVADCTPMNVVDNYGREIQ